MDTRIIILIAIILINPVSAKFICGQVDSQEIISPSWNTVVASLEENKTISTSCQVSPKDNKYCCDIASLKDIFNYTWKSTDIFETKITDTSSGYFAPKQAIILTAQDYDISPTLYLKKAIQTTPEIKTITRSEAPTLITINVAAECDSTIKTFQPKLGRNKIYVQAVCNDKVFTLNKTFYVLEKIEIEKSSSIIKSEEIKEVKIKLTIPKAISNIRLKEYVPKEFKIISTSNRAKIEKSTQDYNVIIWNLSGKSFDLTYKIQAPKISIGSKTYKTITELEEETILEDKIKVQNILPLPSSKVSSNNFKYNPTTFSKVSSQYPIITSIKENMAAALYSKSSQESESFVLQEFYSNQKINRSYKLLNSYYIQTTLPQDEQGNIKFEHTSYKTELEKNNHKRLVFYGKTEKEFYEISSIKITETESQTKYEFESKNPLEEIHIFAEKNSLTLWDKFLNFWDTLNPWE